MKYFFGDNREYGADDIKDALGTLVATGGIAIDFQNDTEYDVNRLNSIIGQSVISGVVPESNSSLMLARENDEYYIYPGRAVFSDGGIAVLEEKTKQEIESGQYLYLAYSVTLDDVYFLTSDAMLTGDGERLLIPIAYVETDGTVKNLREYAKGKVPALANAMWSCIRPMDVSINIRDIRRNGGYINVVHEFEGEMNFMVAMKENTLVSIMHIGDNITYNSSYRNGYSTEFLAVGVSSGNVASGTLLEKGKGYVKMRYKIPGGYLLDNLNFKLFIGTHI